jgi:hypothetical protein
MQRDNTAELLKLKGLVKPGSSAWRAASSYSPQRKQSSWLCRSAVCVDRPVSFHACSLVESLTLKEMQGQQNRNLRSRSRAEHTPQLRPPSLDGWATRQRPSDGSDTSASLDGQSGPYSHHRAARGAGREPSPMVLDDAVPVQVAELQVSLRCSCTWSNLQSANAAASALIRLASSASLTGPAGGAQRAAELSLPRCRQCGLPGAWRLRPHGARPGQPLRPGKPPRRLARPSVPPGARLSLRTACPWATCRARVPAGRRSRHLHPPAPRAAATFLGQGHVSPLSRQGLRCTCALPPGPRAPHADPLAPAYPAAYGEAAATSAAAAVPAAAAAGAAARLQALSAEERGAREAAFKEDERLRSWIQVPAAGGRVPLGGPPPVPPPFYGTRALPRSPSQCRACKCCACGAVPRQDLRGERRRLEDRLLDGDATGARVARMRDELEKQVAGEAGGWEGSLLVEGCVGSGAVHAVCHVGSQPRYRLSGARDDDGGVI